ncbi:class III extradiol ring-cleavage dioxygenase [Cupriavidus metallidurans]|uniref:DODA-type extradiol aromatic ring-opening family dioxygenase n=1 Tax=Cupriavidus TaxID=106589 RepID=UPI00056D143E|nr:MULTISPECIES: class III extradiol ring-cleavage dioxygenase [Cupriavidus]HBD35103.1 dioxygenase [Cupriavidus sp.]
MLPVLYVSHGSPMLAIDPGPTGAAFDALGVRLRALKPKAVLVISAHWIYSTLAVSTRSQQEAWHDFGGFPRELYTLRYDAPGSPELAGRVKALVEAAQIPGAGFVCEDEERPLDHGAWMPLRHFFPDADVPVVQLAFNPYLPPATQIDIGRALAPLREEGVLVIGSGSFTHNLREVFGAGERKAQHGPATEPYVDAFRDWMSGALDEALATGDVSRIADYRAQAPFARRAHPTDEHLLPFYVALGAAIGPASVAAGSARVDRVADEVTYGVLAMDTFVFDGIGTGHAPLQKAA